MAVLKLLDSEMEDVEVADDPLLGKVAKGAVALRCVKSTVLVRGCSN